MGKNYREHVVEFGRSGYDQPDRSEALPEHPVVFTKATTSVTGPFDDIDPHHGVTSELDYEAELGVIIGRGGRGISREDASTHVWGYTIINDFTARDLQRNHKQWLLGKGLDTHCPMGPYAVTADEIDRRDRAAGAELRQRRAPTERPGQGPDLRHPGADRDHLGRASRCCPATSSPPAPRPGSASGSTRPSSWSPATSSRSSITGLGAQRNRIAD